MHDRRQPPLAAVVVPTLHAPVVRIEVVKPRWPLLAANDAQRCYLLCTNEWRLGRSAAFQGWRTALDYRGRLAMVAGEERLGRGRLRGRLHRRGHRRE
jgi:hypothetical protein